MSLLLDARKKSQQAQAGQGSNSGIELSLEPTSTPADPQPDAPKAATAGEQARMAGQNLFNARSGAVQPARPGFNRNLLFALVGAVLLLAAGAGYVWYAISSGNSQPARAINMTAMSHQKPAPPQNNLVPGVVSAEAASPKPAGTPIPRHAARHPAKAAPTSPPEAESVHIVISMEGPLNQLLNDAYLAYRAGNLDQAQQLYLKAANLDSSNSDALLGLAVIAQRRGEHNVAAHYYAQVLALDPRNAVANAGMSALSEDEDSESRLKMLLDEQPNSPSLHLALGNYYAEHARWSEAQKSYFDAYKLSPDHAELAFNLAVSLDRLGQNKAAAQYYRRALQLDPGHHADFDHAKISQRIEELAH